MLAMFALDSLTATVGLTVATGAETSTGWGSRLAGPLGVVLLYGAGELALTALAVRMTDLPGPGRRERSSLVSPVPGWTVPRAIRGGGRMVEDMIAPGGSLTLADGLTLSRMGYGAMQLAGPGVLGPPRDRDAAVAVLREAVDVGVTHIDTSDFYGPVTVNELIREALHPYPDGLHIVTKVGARRGDDGAGSPALAPDELPPPSTTTSTTSAWTPSTW